MSAQGIWADCRCRYPRVRPFLSSPGCLPQHALLLCEARRLCDGRLCRRAAGARGRPALPAARLRHVRPLRRDAAAVLQPRRSSGGRAARLHVSVLHVRRRRADAGARRCCLELSSSVCAQGTMGGCSDLSRHTRLYLPPCFGSLMGGQVRDVALGTLCFNGSIVLASSPQCAPALPAPSNTTNGSSASSPSSCDCGVTVQLSLAGVSAFEVRRLRRTF